MARQLAMSTLQSAWYRHCTPGRPFSHICTLSRPGHLPEQCPFSHCRVEGCRANQIECAADGASYTLHVPHSKTSASMVGPISYTLPPSLFPWMDAWLRFGWPIVAKEVSCCCCRSCCCLHVLAAMCGAPPLPSPPPPHGGFDATAAAPTPYPCALLPSGTTYHCLLHSFQWSPHLPQQAHLPLQGGWCWQQLYCLYCRCAQLPAVRATPAGLELVCTPFDLCAGVA